MEGGDCFADLEEKEGRLGVEVESGGGGFDVVHRVVECDEAWLGFQTRGFA
jgi:hypothetical protein